jgi:isoleucyl-tRNA synthetase
VPDTELLPLDRYMLTRARELVEKVCGADGKSGWYGDFQFHRVYHAVNDFCIVDLSAFYLDLLKDRLYTFAPRGLERRSAQTVLWRIAEALVRLVAPILTFTSDEVWQHLPAVSDRPASVHLAMFPKADDLGVADPELVEDWGYLLKMREWVLKKIEEMRQGKKIGKGLEAKVCLQFVGTSGNLSDIKKYEQSLKELFNVSQVSQVLEVSLDNVRVERVSSDQFKVYEGPEEGLDLYIDVVAASGHKCDRCWNYYADDSPQHVRQFGPWPNVCGRCADALRQMGYTGDTE